MGFFVTRPDDNTKFVNHGVSVSDFAVRDNIGHEKVDRIFIKAMSVAIQSKDPLKKVGAIIIDNCDFSTLSDGYNGMPFGTRDSDRVWEKNNKKSLVVHAELNAIILARRDLRNSILVATLKPCNVCASAIVQAGIKEVWYPYKEYKSGDKYDMADVIFNNARTHVIAERIELVYK